MNMNMIMMMMVMMMMMMHGCRWLHTQVYWSRRRLWTVKQSTGRWCGLLRSDNITTASSQYWSSSANRAHALHYSQVGALPPPLEPSRNACWTQGWKNLAFFNKKIGFRFLFFLTYKCRTRNYDPQAQWKHPSRVSKDPSCERYKSQCIFKYHFIKLVIKYVREKNYKEN